LKKSSASSVETSRINIRVGTHGLSPRLSAYDRVGPSGAALLDHAEKLRKNQRQALLASAVLKKEARKVKEKGSHEAPPPKPAFA